MFRSLPPKTVRWRPLEGDGLEHLTIAPIDEDGAAIRAESVVIGNRANKPYGVRYRIDCDVRWRVLSFLVESMAGEHLSLKSDGNGRWQTAKGTPIPAYDGCLDIDLAGTPFTNTLPIRRLGLTPKDGTVKLTMLYVPFDTFEPFPDGQNYTCIEEDRLYRYEAEDRSFTVELPVDEDGLVTDYPTLFQRL